MTYAARIRHSLAASRTRGLTFPAAWDLATRDTTPGLDPWDKDSRSFLRKEMEAAYAGLSRFKKPIRVEPPDTTPDGLRRPHTASQGVDHLGVQPNPRCKSGDRCSAPATHGTFGLKFCERHYDEIHRIVGVESEREQRMREHHAKMARAA